MKAMNHKHRAGIAKLLGVCAALDAAVARELQAAKDLLSEAMPLLSSDKLDAQLVRCAVLASATPVGLTDFAQQGREQEALVAKLLADTTLMKEMLAAGGSKDGKYGAAMQIYDSIQKASPRAKEGLFHRLAVATSIEHAEPVKQGKNANGDHIFIESGGFNGKNPVGWKPQIIVIKKSRN
jgi:16S rRNA G1207 methylase RsmC